MHISVSKSECHHYGSRLDQWMRKLHSQQVHTENQLISISRELANMNILGAVAPIEYPLTTNIISKDVNKQAEVFHHRPKP